MHTFVLWIFIICLLYMRFIDNSHSETEQMFIMMIVVVTMSQLIIIQDLSKNIKELKLEVQKLKVKLAFKDVKSVFKDEER